MNLTPKPDSHSKEGVRLWHQTATSGVRPTASSKGYQDTENCPKVGDDFYAIVEKINCKKAKQ